MTRVRFFAAAAEAAGRDEQQVTAASIGAVIEALRADHDEEFGRVLDRCAILVNGARATDAASPAGPDDTIDVLPPFAGG